MRIVDIFLLFAAGSSETNALRVFPSSFIGAWGVEGKRCGMRGTHRVVIGPRLLAYDGIRARMNKILPGKGNVVEVTYYNGGKVQTDQLTIGTTGSRLFRERGNRSLNIYYRCEITPAR